jgi:hypothetical protein
MTGTERRTGAPRQRTPSKRSSGVRAHTIGRSTSGSKLSRSCRPAKTKIARWDASFCDDWFPAEQRLSAGQAPRRGHSEASCPRRSAGARGNRALGNDVGRACGDRQLDSFWPRGFASLRFRGGSASDPPPGEYRVTPWRRFWAANVTEPGSRARAGARLGAHGGTGAPKSLQSSL